MARVGIDPRTGRRYGWVDPLKAAKAAKVASDPTMQKLSADVLVLERQHAAARAREKFMPFVLFTSPDPEDPNDATRSSYKNAKHHDAVARVLEDVVAGKIPFLIITLPPRHGKSELVSRRLPAWFVGQNPSAKVIVSTYSDTFAQDFGRDVRSIMKSSAYKLVFPGVELARGGAAADRLNLTTGGQLNFVGRGGALTGRGAHLLIIDDLMKDAAEASSPAIRDQAWEWFTKVAMSRRMGKKLVIMTFTRWHADDPIGRLTDPENPYYSAKMASKIKVINLPAIAEDDDPLGRAPGEPLWPDGPDKFDLDFLEEQQAIDPAGFAALYQQRPSAVDGILFQRANIRRYKVADLPAEMRYYCASDHAVAIKQRNDYTVLLKVGVDALDNIYLLDCFWQRTSSDAAVEAMLVMAGGNKRPLLWWAERGQISQSIGPFLYRRMNETGTYINLVEVTPASDKQQRAQSIAARVAQGKVYIPVEAPWAERAIDQLLGFPNGTHDDFVDALAYIGLGLQSQVGPSRVVAPKAPPAYGTLGWVKLNDRWTAERKAAARVGGF